MAKEDLLHGNPDTQFRAGQEQVSVARKGGIASGIARRKKNASRKFLREVLALEPKKTPDMIKTLEKLGADPDFPLTVEQVGVLALIKKFWAGDLRAYDMIHEYLGEDPHTLMEERRLKVSKDAVNALKNSDGFLQAMSGITEEVMADGGDTPEGLDDTEE